MPIDSKPVILLVRREDDSRELYAEFLRHHGFPVLVAADADRALATAPLADLIVTGIVLDGPLDGIEMIARLRRDNRTNRIPIIVLTACALPADRRRAEAAGCNAFLLMPCLPEDLLRHVRFLLASGRRPTKSRLARMGGRHVSGRKTRT